MKARRKGSPAKPVEIHRGNVCVKIYPTVNRVGNVSYPQPTLVYYEGAKRIRRRFSDWDEARREAERVATNLANGEHEVLKLTPADRAAYVQACNLLKPFDRPLPLAVSEYVDVLKLLPPGSTLKEAVTDFARRQNIVRGTRTVSELVAEFVTAKEQAGRSTRHLGDLRGRLSRFAKAFSIPVTQLTGPTIQAYLDSLGVRNRSKLNEMRHIASLVRFAVRRKYAPRDLLDELESIERPETPPTETLIFTPDELREMFESLRSELIPWLTVAAFCGLRTAEIMRMDWSDVNLDRAFVQVRAGIAKTAARRLVPLCDAAIAWLRPHARPAGRLAYYTEENKFYHALLSNVNRSRKTAMDTGEQPPFKWKRNGLRHSFCSYRLAVTHDAARVALEAGNSPTMIFRHYRELVSEDQGKAWFAIHPHAEQSIE